MLLVDLNYNFECEWFVELSDNKLSDNKLSDNNLASELVGNRSFFKPITIEEIAIFMIINVTETLISAWLTTQAATQEGLWYLKTMGKLQLLVLGNLQHGAFRLFQKCN